VELSAGILFAPYQKTKDGFESQMAVNFLGHALLSHLLMPQLIAGSNENQRKNSRIVNVSSCANECGEIDYDDFNKEKYYHAGLQYGNSKLAQILFTNHLEKMCIQKGLKIQTHCAHPGIVDTEIFQTTPIFGSLDFLRRWFFKVNVLVVKYVNLPFNLLFFTYFSQTPERGARTIVYAAIAPEIEGAGGTYLSNCRVTSVHDLASSKVECKKFFNFTCDLLNIKEFC
jgi:NAD(P)-dependent dehydrogenase (short-subunit alcohol dehydrogenase family)